MIIQTDVMVTPDRPTVRFRKDRGLVELDKELTKVLHGQGWGCGTYFNVQFVTHEKTNLLSSALFVVTESDQTLVTSNDNPYEPLTKTIHTRKAEIVGEWWYSEVGKDLRDAPVPEEKPPEMRLDYDKTAKLHQVRLGTEILFENSYKGKCQEYIRSQRT